MDAIQQAITLLRESGYRVTKVTPRKAVPTLNAVGRPFSPLYDPKYKIKTPLTSIARLSKPMSHHVQWVQS